MTDHDRRTDVLQTRRHVPLLSLRLRTVGPVCSTRSGTEETPSEASGRSMESGTLRRRRGHPRGAVGGIVLDRLVVLLLELLAELGREPVAEDRAQGVVGLVLEAAGEQAVAGEGDRLPGEPGAGDRGDVGSRALHERARERQAALVGHVQLPVAALGQGEHRVADDADGALERLVRAVEDEDGQVDTDLARREADPVGGVHRRDHVRDQGAQLVVVRRHRLLGAVHDRGAPPRHRADRPALRERAVWRVGRWFGGRGMEGSLASAASHV